MLTGGAYVAVTQVPSLKTRVTEYVNPRVKEARLINQLQSDLQVLGDQTTAPATIRQTASKAKDLAAQIAAINDNSSGLVPTIVTKVRDAASAIAPLLPASVAQFLPIATPAPTPACPTK